jgi:ATP-binding cassette subfamily F protein uup
VARNVVGYLKDFLFDETQARAPVRALSGGEKARLLLARIMAQPANLLVLDEPTNDLDIETLDLLEELLGDYDGTVLLVSHDRDFIDRVATTTVAMEGGGRAVVYAGGWTDYQAQRGEMPAAVDDGKSKGSGPKLAPQAKRAPQGMSFVEKHRLEALPGEIERLESEIGKLAQLLADPELFTREPVKFRKATEALAERQARLSAAEEEWLALEEKAAS